MIVLDAELSEADEAALAAARGAVVILGTVVNEALRNAELVLPVTNMAEENGTYVNRDRRVQRFHQAKSQPGMARPAWWVAGEVLAGRRARAPRRRLRPRRRSPCSASGGRSSAGSPMPTSASPAACWPKRHPREPRR